MIQSRFQGQHQSKHPRKPENGGSGPALPKPPAVDPIDSAVGAFMNDVRAGDKKGANTRLQEFTRQNVLRSAADLAQTRGDAELDSARMYGGKVGELIFDQKARRSYKTRDDLTASADSLVRGRTRGQKKKK